MSIFKVRNDLNMFWQVAFVGVFLIKLLAMVLFSSDYQNQLFLPFVTHFLENGGNPWQYFYEHPENGVEFPYSAAMLYLLSLFYAPVHFLGLESPGWQNFFIKLPTLILDVAMAGLLIRQFGRPEKVWLYYFANPIIIYACYLHSQIDLIPSAFLFFAVLLLSRRRVVGAALLYGWALATKSHVLAVMPLLLVVIYRRWGWGKLVRFSVVAPVVFGVLVGPYWSDGYIALVLNNAKQMMIYDSFIGVGSLKIFLPLLLVCFLYARFAAFRKINNDLFYTFLAMVFAAFIALTQSAPGWYVWLFPFLSIFFIKFDHGVPEVRKLYCVLNVFYLIYMVMFFIPEFHDLILWQSPVGFKWDDEKLRNISFTLLEVSLFCCVYAFYKFGVKSNFFYRSNAPAVIGIAGDSAAGKTTLLEDVRLLLGEKILLLEGDADHKWERGDPNWEQMTHLNPKANYLYRQYEDIVNLRFGKSIYRSDYDHVTGRFAASRKLKARDYIVISGLHSFYLPKMRKVVDLKIFVDPEEKLRQHWKVARDVRERSYSKEKVLRQMESRNEDSLKYIRPQHGFADMVVSYTTDSDFKIGDDAALLRLKLKLIVNSNLPLNEVVTLLQQRVRVDWDYAADLRTQTLVIEGAVERDFIRDLARRTVMNLEDLTGPEPVWADGYRGLVQYMILFHLSETIKTQGSDL